MKPSIYALIAIFSLAFNLCFAQQSINIIALEHGSRMVKVPPSKVDVTERQVLAKYSPGALFDQGPNVWSSKSVRFPFEFLVELAEEYRIQKLVFNNKCEFYPGIETKKVRVEVSTTDKDTGFESVGEYELQKEALNEFDIAPKKARWIKLVILENYGNNERVQLAEFEAIGVPANQIKRTVEIGGVWHTNWQDITFEQNGDLFSGSYVYTADKRKFKGKVLNGKFNRNSVEFDWDEGKIEGSAKLYLNQEGNQMSGLWKNAANPRDYNLWTMTRTQVESKPIEYEEPVEEPVAEIVEEEEEPEEVMEEVATVKEVVPEPVPVPKAPIKIGDDEITVGKEIILKNVFFELGKSRVMARSHDELNKLFDYLSENPKTEVVINGHTDKIGDRKKNMILSQQRADAIKEYLTEKGIEKKRITTNGLGDTKTLCAPPCKENRRVDFVLVEN